MFKAALPNIRLPEIMVLTDRVDKLVTKMKEMKFNLEENKFKLGVEEASQ